MLKPRAALAALKTARVLRAPAAPLAACALLLAAQVGPWWYSSTDSASYLSMARSLARGAGPLNLGSRLWWYSPGYPALVSPLFLLSPRPFFWIMAFHWLLAVGLMLGVYVWARRAAPQAAAWIAALTVVNHGFWLHYRRPLSEVAFMCALVWTVNALAVLPWQGRMRTFVSRLSCAAALVALLCAIRPVGVMIAPALAASVFCRRPPRLRAAAAVLAIGAAASLPVGLFVLHERLSAAELGGRTYLDEFHDAARTPLTSWSAGVQMCVSDIGRVCIPGLFKSHGSPGDWTDVNMLLHVPFFALVSIGWRRLTRVEADPFAWFMPFYFLLIAAHAMDAGARLMLPLLPALLLCAWFGLERIGPQRRVVFGVCLALQLLAAGGYWLAIDLPRARQADRYWAAIDRLVPAIAAEPEAKVAADLPGELQLMLEVALDRPVRLRRETERDSDALPVDWLVSLAASDGSGAGPPRLELRALSSRRLAEASSLSSSE